MKSAIRYMNMGPWPVYVGFTTSEKAFAAEMRRLNIKDPPSFLVRDRANAAVHSFTSESTLTCIIAIRPYSRTSTREQYAALVAHEAMHVVQMMKEELSAGSPLGSEAEAYLIQMFVQECLQEAWKSGRTRKEKP